MNNQNYAKEATIAQIEKQKQFFEIPPYQRLYEWGKDEIETLLDDMKKAHLQNKKNKEEVKPEKSYFIGNITTSKKGDSFVLIDGQQRITTLWFIGFYLASKGCDEWQEFILQDEKLRITMPIRDKEREALESLAKKIQKHNKEEKLELSKDLQGIHQKIIDAFGCIESWFASENGKDIDLANFAKYIYESVRFVFVELAQNTDLNRFFVRMNNRGKQLEKHEILKARILSVIQQGGGEWQKYAKIWDLCSDMNKYIFQSASDRNFLNSENEGGEKWGIDTIISGFDERSVKGAQNDDTPDKVESIIDFPTFLLHCYILYPQNNSVPITQDKLLENFNLSKMDSKSCKWFIIDMLYYRVLFDYFVIKNNAEQGNGFRIRRLYPYKDKNQKTYYRLPEDSKSVADSPLHNLAMIQNYLRVARQGERQNYHHWLTPFLQFLHKSELINYDYIKPEMWNPDEICKTFAKNDEGKQDNLVKFLKILDTNLAIAQLNDNELLNESNKAIKEAQNYQLTETPANIDLDSILDSRLNNGTGTPHYWFYRLEYYLWKWGTLDDKDFGAQCKEKFGDKFDDLKSMFNAKLGTQHNFKSIAKNFYFRNLNSVEHIQPQSRAKDEQKKWRIYKDKDNKIIKRDIDCFGNLALLSVGFNSSLSNQDNADKRLDLQKKINKSEVESLKLWLVFANYPKDEDWTCANAQVHQNQMLDILIESLKSSQEK